MPFKHLTAESSSFMNIDKSLRKYTIIWISRWYITQNRKCISIHVIIVSFNFNSNHSSINYKSCTGKSLIMHLKKTTEFKTQVCPSLVWIIISKHEPFEKDTGGLGFSMISISLRFQILFDWSDRILRKLIYIHMHIKR